MRRHVLVLTTTAAILACGAVAASAPAQTDTQQSPVRHPTLAGPMMQHQDTQMNDDDVLPFDDEDDQNVIEPGMTRSHGVLPSEGENDQNGIYLIEPRMMSGETVERGWHHGWRRGRAMMPPVMARIIFSLMDADGDGTVSLQEWQAAHERIFKAMDTDHDGTVTFEEMQAFMHGRGWIAPAAPR
jgi:hypothetical protein